MRIGIAAIGALIGIKHKFRNNAWWILIIIGVVNLTPQFMIMGRPSRHFVWPAMIILAGLAIAFRPRRDRCYPVRGMSSSINAESTLNIDATFGGRKEVVTSKDFKGGVVSVTFGGCELNLTQADFTEASVALDPRAFGVKLHTVTANLRISCDKMQRSSLPDTGIDDRS